MRGELDDTAAFKNFNKWGSVEFPLPFSRVLSPTETFIHSLDERTSASLKFTVLNPKGRIWTMVAGGGASVIYADTVGDLGYALELGNYAEYSGAPNEEVVLQYARVAMDCATADPDGRKRALIIGGGIANFRDVAATFHGIIRALREKESKLKAARMHIFVRRGGPNYQTGLAKMCALGEELGVPLEVYGPEAAMTGIYMHGLVATLQNLGISNLYAAAPMRPTGLNIILACNILKNSPMLEMLKIVGSEANQSWVHKAKVRRILVIAGAF
ncbi:unnamed protein product [Malus baccata var. baccata]